VRNSSPVAQLFGLPSFLGARAVDAKGAKNAGSVEVRFSVDVANSFTGDTVADELVFLDGETSVITYQLRRGFAERFEWGMQLPWVVHSGGRFDSVIEEFHDLFGLPDGGRPLAPKGQVDYLVRISGEDFVEIDSKTSDLGDIRGWLGYELHASAERSLVARAMLKLPTGELATLSGSGAADGALSVEYTDIGLLRRLQTGITAGVGLSLLGKGDLWPDAQARTIGFAHLGLNVALSERFSLIGQLDAHEAPFEAQLSHLGNSVLQGTLGARLRLGDNLRLELGLVEDLSGGLAADVIFKFALSGSLK
jgi:hypothetical protein